MARRILLLITDLLVGGTPTVVRELAIRLNQWPDVEIEVACLATWGPVADELSAAGIPVTALEAKGVTDLGVVPRLTKLIRTRRFDTVFSFLIHANAIAAAASLRCRQTRFIQSIQTTQPTPRWHWWLQAIVQQAAEVIVVPSPSVAQAAEDWAQVPAEKIRVIPNAIDPNAFAIARDDSTPSSTTRVGFIGRLDPIKRIGDLVEATALLPEEYRLDVFGEGSERAAIASSIARLGLGNRVTLHGAISRPQEALARIDVLVLPSLAEGFGLVLIEAMAARVPVVATNVTGIRDVVKDGKTGLLVPPMSPTEIAGAIRRVVEDAGLRGKLIEAARADVAARFSWDEVIANYARLLHSPSPP